MDAVAESGRYSVSKHQPIRFSPSEENEWADAEWDGPPRLARSNSQARTGIWNASFFLLLTTSEIGNVTRMIHTLLEVLIIHTMYPTQAFRRLII